MIAESYKQQSALSQYVDNALYCVLFPKLLLPASQGSNILPIGTILPYTGDLSDIPHGWFLCDGNHGTPDLRDRFLQGSDVPGNFVESGLPNITGTWDSVVEFWNGGYRAVDSGAISSIGYGGGYDMEVPNISSPGYVKRTFDASRCSPIYGNSNTVQPASYTVYYIRRMM